MAAILKVSQTGVEVASRPPDGSTKISQVVIEAATQVPPSPTALHVSQSIVEAAQVGEEGQAACSFFGIEVAVKLQQALSPCPLFGGDEVFILPPGVLVGDGIYSWRVQAKAGTTMGSFSNCCTFRAIAIGTRVSQFCIEVARKRI